MIIEHPWLSLEKTLLDIHNSMVFAFQSTVPMNKTAYTSDYVTFQSFELATALRLMKPFEGPEGSKIQSTCPLAGKFEPKQFRNMCSCFEITKNVKITKAITSSLKCTGISPSAKWTAAMRLPFAH